MAQLELYRKYEFGDMKVYYLLDRETEIMELRIMPINIKSADWGRKRHEADSLIQVKLAGDTYTGGYSGGMTMRQCESVHLLKFQELRRDDRGDYTEVIVTLYDQRGYEALHHLRYYEGTKAFEIFTEFMNVSEKSVMIEMLSSFSLSGITPMDDGDVPNQLILHRMRSVWASEAHPIAETFEDLNLIPLYYPIRSLRFGQAGSMPVNGYFPYAVVEDTKNNICFGAKIAYNGSWQMEVFRKDDIAALSGGLADRELGHWMKTMEPGETFVTPKAIVSVCEGDVNELSQRMLSIDKLYVLNKPLKEQELPIIFNEYCTTWGNPSQGNIASIVKKIKNKGFEYFVIDCGWFKKTSVPWDISMGDYNVSSDLFPDGLEKTVETIKEAGMIPGIWFEIDNVGKASEAYQDETHLLKKDGSVLTTAYRRFWNMCDPYVEDYLTEKVIGTLEKYGFGYIKMDYNDSIGIGCDGYESLGEGLRRNMEASYHFIRKIESSIPDIIIENCASGGHKLEPLMMQASSMASFSDAHELEEIPVIAAYLHRMILPQQSQIWAVIREKDSLKRIAYSMINTFLGRMCLSGDVTNLSDKQWNVIERGILFYRKIVPIIRDGFTYYYGPMQTNYRHLNGWQAILRISDTGKAYILIHVFDGDLPEKIKILFPKGYEFKVVETYSDDDPEIKIDEKKLIYYPNENRKAVAIYLKRK